jgi:hypothetical protein
MNITRCNKCGTEGTVMAQVPIIAVDPDMSAFITSLWYKTWQVGNHLCGPCAKKLMQEFNLKGTLP